MSYEHTPRPNIEYHPHIRYLIETQEKRVEDRIRFRENEKIATERDQLIKDAKLVELVEFWCASCREDFKGVAIKQVEQDWSCNGQWVAFYKTKCFRGHWCMRLITDKNRDGYWTRSRQVLRDRGTHFKDVLQPWESGFQLLYGRKNT